MLTKVHPCLVCQQTHSVIYLPHWNDQQTVSQTAEGAQKPQHQKQKQNIYIWYIQGVSGGIVNILGCGSMG
jgi:hypothetical protein